MKKRNFLTGTLLTLCAASLAFGFASCTPSESSSTPETGWGTVFTLETAYAQAQALGYTGSLEDFIQSISGKDGTDGKDGEDGKDGVGIANIGFNANGELIITLTNSTNVNLGKFTVFQGPAGEKGEDGKDGEQGVGIAKAENVDGYLVITLTDGTKLDPIEIPAGGSASVAQESLLYQKIKGEEAYRVIGLGNVSDYDIVIPSTYKGLPVTEIGEQAFSYHLNSEERSAYITSVTIPDSVTKIDKYAFRECIGLTSVYFGENSQLTTIGNEAFYSCRSLTSITIPDSVTSIGSGAFYGCSNLTSINIPDGVTSIGSGAFYGCSSLTSITFPDNVTSIDSAAFYGCNNLISITVAEGNTTYHSEGNCLIETATNTLILACKNYVIPDSVTSIGDYAFSGCSSLTSITIPDSVTSIGDYAFYGCSSLTSITIPDSVTSIGSSAFSGCSNLTSVYYEGTREQWSNINIGNDNYYLKSATRYYYSETKPTDTANKYWHYVDGEIVVWTKESV